MELNVLVEKKYAENGVKIVTYKPGLQEFTDSEAAKCFLDNGWAEIPKKKKAPQNKALGDAPQNKTAKGVNNKKKDS